MRLFLCILLLLPHAVFAAAGPTNRIAALQPQGALIGSEFLVVDSTNAGTRKLTIPGLFSGTVVGVSNEVVVTAGGTTNWSYFRDIVSLPTIADLATWVPGVVTNFAVLGYRTPGDWGGPRFGHYDADSVATTNRGCVFQPSVSDGRNIFDDCDEGEADLRWFGAIGDATTDNSASIQSAVDTVWARLSPAGKRAGGTVFTPAGTFGIRSTIVLKPRVSLRGMGVTFAQLDSVVLTNSASHGTGPSRWLLLTNADVPMISFAAPDGYSVQAGQLATDQYQYAIKIEGMSFNGQGFYQRRDDCHIITINGGWGITIRNCAFYYPRGYCIQAFDVNAFDVLDCHAEAIGGTAKQSKGFVFWGTADSKIMRNNFGGFVGPTIWICNFGGWRNLVADNILFNDVASRVAISSVDTNTGTVTLSGNHRVETGMLMEVETPVGSVAPAGLTNYTPYFVVNVASNQLRFATTPSNALAGVTLPITNVGTGTNNVWTGPGSGFYGSGQSTGIAITGNRLDQHEEHGIMLSDVGAYAVTGNLISDNQFDTSIVTPSATPAAGVYVRGTLTGDVTISGNVFTARPPTYPQAYGVWVEEGTADFFVKPSARRGIQIIGNSFGILGDRAVRIDANNPYVAFTDMSEESSSPGAMEVGYGTKNASLRVIGSTNGVPGLLLGRTGSDEVGFVNSAGRLIVNNATRGRTSFIAENATNTVGIVLGANTTTAPRQAYIYGESASSGTNVNSTIVILQNGLGIGTNAGGYIRLAVAESSTNETTAQVAVEKLRVDSNVVSNQTPLSLRINGTLSRVAVTNIGGVNYLYVP